MLSIRGGLLAFACALPQEPFAFKALVQAAWQANGTPWPVALVGDDRASGRALALLLRCHADSAELAPLCRRISCVGATAPGIEGDDQHGVRSKLGDDRGKVVLIGSWSWV